MARHIKVYDIGSGYPTIVRTVLEQGEEVLDERGSNTTEILNLLVEISHPTNPIPSKFYWSGSKLKKYIKQFISKDKLGFIYTYGNRLRNHFIYSEADLDGNIEVYPDCRLDQIDEAILRIKNYINTRRATCVTWDPVLDTRLEDVPCMILVDFKVRPDKKDGNKLKLHTTGVWRSHDIYGAWMPNAVGLTELAKYVAESVNVKMGTVVTQSISAHIYEVNYDDAKAIL
jgi:thymidylate synthase